MPVFGFLHPVTPGLRACLAALGLLAMAGAAPAAALSGMEVAGLGRSHTGDPDDHWDARFGGPFGADGTVRAMVQLGGDLYVGGDFRFIGDVEVNGIARWDGTSWHALGTGVGDQGVHAMAVIGTDLYVGGTFHSIGGITTSAIAKWDGSTWSALGDGVLWAVYALEVVGSELYVGGNFYQAGSTNAASIARWDGSSWHALGSGITDVGVGIVYALESIGSDLYVGGDFTQAGGTAASNMAKWNGSSWTALGSGTDQEVFALANYGGALWVGGRFAQAGSLPTPLLAKWDGSGWLSSGAGLYGSSVRSLVVTSSGLGVAGEFQTVGNWNGGPVALWNGTTWTALYAGETDSAAIHAVAEYEGEIVAGGWFPARRAMGVYAGHLVRWDGEAWAPFGSGSGQGVGGQINALLVAGSDLYAGGYFRNAGGVAADSVARWDGNQWHSLDFGWSNSDFLETLETVGGDLYACGYFIRGGTSVGCLRRQGTEWTPLPGTSQTFILSSLVVGSDLYVGGSFTTIGGVSANYIAKWDGSSWSALGAGLGAEPRDLAMVGGDLYAGGYFTTAGGSAVPYVARWNGSSWSSLGSGLDGIVETLLAVGSDLYVGGNFLEAGGMPATRVARWDGSNWHAMGSISGNVLSLGVVDGQVHAGGWFSTADGNPVNGIARWDGSTWNAVGSGTQVNGSGVLAIAELHGNLFVAGDFTRAGGKPSLNVGQYSYGSCGNGTLDAGESCDPSIAGTGTCCNATTCQFAAAGATCRAAVGPCDAAETCDGVSAACPADVLQPAGTECDVIGDICYVTECKSCTLECTGMSPGCTLDYVLSPAGTPCRSAVGSCDAVEECTGASPDCPADAPAPVGFVCRPIDRPCDIAETCDGVAMDCPMNTSNCGYCGDGITVVDEQCDDGNFLNGDGCDENCTSTGCGNGIVTAGEDCDDGNLVHDDGCNDECRVVECGDGLLTRGQLANCTPGAACADVCDPAWTYPFGARIEPSAGIHSAFLDGEDFWVGGEFGYGTDMRAIAKWNNGVWAALASGLGDGDNAVYDIVKYGAQIHAGGDFVEIGGTGAPAGCLAKWNGSAWTAVGGGLGSADGTCGISDLLVSGSDLYVAGRFETAGGVAAANVARWDGSSWHALGSGTDARVTSLATDGTNLYAGGIFSIAGGVAAEYVARWDGSTWSAIGADLPSFVETLVFHEGSLYAGGEGYIRRWNGLAWTDLATIPVDYFEGTGRVTSAVVAGGDLIIGGNFELGSAKNIARFDGTNWSALGSGVDGPYSQKVTGMAADGQRVIVVGEFANAGGASSPQLAVWNRTTCGEQCDDGNAVEGDGCDSNCSITSCGNGIAAAGEACDDGNATQGDGCDSNCTASGCGNGVRSAGESCDDGNAIAGDGCESDCRISTVTSVVSAGGSVSTPPPSPQNPVQTTVVTPTGGEVSIASAPAGGIPTGAFSIVGAVLEISAPDATVTDPLVITLAVDFSAIPAGHDAESIVVLRDGVELTGCTGPSGHAVSDPCVESRSIVGDAVEIRVLSSHASIWGPVVPALTRDEQKCANGVAKAAVGVVKSLAKSAAKCLKNAESGDVDLDECVAVTAGAKAAKSMAKTSKSADGCPDGVPFGYVDAVSANLAARSAATALLSSVLGTDMSATLEATPGAAACRAALVQASSKLFLSEAGAFLACQKSGLAGEPVLFTTPDDLASCLAEVQLDEKGKIAAAHARLVSAVGGKCASASDVPGSCSGAADVAACLHRSANCQLCRLFDGIGALAQSCDQYDDGTANGSCAP